MIFLKAYSAENKSRKEIFNWTFTRNSVPLFVEKDLVLQPSLNQKFFRGKQRSRTNVVCASSSHH